VCAASRHNLSRSVGVEEASGSPWEHAEVVHKGEGAEQEGGAGNSAGPKERENKNKKIRKNEPVQETGTKQVGDEVSGESTGRANRSAKRVQTPTKGSRGRTQVQELTRYRKPGATAAKPRDTRKQTVSTPKGSKTRA